jgi:hypothetical protein
MLFGEATANTFPISSFQKFTDAHCTLEDNPNILISENITPLPLPHGLVKQILRRGMPNTLSLEIQEKSTFWPFSSQSSDLEVCQ